MISSPSTAASDSTLTAAPPKLLDADHGILAGRYGKSLDQRTRHHSPARTQNGWGILRWPPVQTGCAYLVTRNAKDFKGSPVPARTAGELLSLLPPHFSRA